MATFGHGKLQMLVIVAAISMSEASNLTRAECSGTRVPSCQTDPPSECNEKYIETVQGEEGIQCGMIGTNCLARGSDGCTTSNCFCTISSAAQVLSGTPKQTKGYTCKEGGIATDSDDSQKYTLTVPSGISQIKAYLIGASGGEGRNYDYGAWSGGGGYTEGQFQVTAGQKLTIAVGSGGEKGFEGSGGGGYSGIFSGSSMTQAKSILIAGGGGAGSCCSYGRGGGGGGEKGEQATARNGAKQTSMPQGGSQAAGGSGEGNGKPGSALKGGDAAQADKKGGWPGGGAGSNRAHPGGGGGGGYWGGGAGNVGSDGADAGGGGSGYIGGSSENKILQASMYTAKANVPPPEAKPDTLKTKANAAGVSAPPNNVGQGWGKGSPLGSGGSSCGYILLELY